VRGEGITWKRRLGDKRGEGREASAEKREDEKSDIDCVGE